MELKGRSGPDFRLLSSSGEEKSISTHVSRTVAGVGLHGCASKQANVPFTSLIGQFGWHILGISAHSVTATCTPSTDSHLHLQMVHFFFFFSLPFFIVCNSSSRLQKRDRDCSFTMSCYSSQVDIKFSWSKESSNSKSAILFILCWKKNISPVPAHTQNTTAAEDWHMFVVEQKEQKILLNF